MNTFLDLGVMPAFADKLAARAINQPTEIQCRIIPALLEGKSIIFRSETGTGKTFAYLIPFLQRMYGDAAAHDCASGPALVVCAPTLELCSQIAAEIDFLTGGGRAALLAGSVNINRQIDALKKNKPMAVVGNPGRLLLLAKMGKLKFGGLRFLVLDEADRLTATDSRDEMLELARLAAANAAESPCVAASSATVSAKIAGQLDPLLKGAAFIETDAHEILRDRIEHWAIFSEGRGKAQTLSSFLAAAKPKKALVFTSRAYDAGKIVSVLQRRQCAAAGLYSGMDKKERKTAIDHFRSGKAAVLVSSDLSARGLDISGISHVIALDVSDNKDVYIHRAGRTGRAGKKGIMVSIGDEVEMRRLAALEKKLGIKVQPKELYGGKLLKPEINDNGW